MLKKVVKGTWRDPLVLGVAFGNSSSFIGKLRWRHDFSRRRADHSSRNIHSFQVAIIEAVWIIMKPRIFTWTRMKPGIFVTLS
jgi:hypothetical protein